MTFICIELPSPFLGFAGVWLTHALPDLVWEGELRYEPRKPSNEGRRQLFRGKFHLATTACR